MHTRHTLALLALSILLSLVGCSSKRDELVISFVPSESNEAIREDYEPVRAYLEKKLGKPVRMVTVPNYATVIESMRKGRVDVARLGPFSYVLSEREADTEVFAREIRNDGQPTYRSLILVRADSPAKSLKDLKGKNVAFVDPNSTSGCLMPTYLIKKHTGQKPEEWFGSLVWAGSHDAAQIMLKAGQVDAAASNDITFTKLKRLKTIGENDLRVLKRSEPLPGIPLVWRKGLDEKLKKQIRTAILSAHKETEVSGQKKFLRYEPSSPKDYQLIRDLIDELGMGRDSILK